MFARANHRSFAWTRHQRLDVWCLDNTLPLQRSLEPAAAVSQCWCGWESARTCSILFPQIERRIDHTFWMCACVSNFVRIERCCGVTKDSDVTRCLRLATSLPWTAFNRSVCCIEMNPMRCSLARRVHQPVARVRSIWQLCEIVLGSTGPSTNCPCSIDLTTVWDCPCFDGSISPLLVFDRSDCVRLSLARRVHQPAARFLSIWQLCAIVLGSTGPSARCSCSIDLTTVWDCPWLDGSISPLHVFDRCSSSVLGQGRLKGAEVINHGGDQGATHDAAGDKGGKEGPWRPPQKTRVVVCHQEWSGRSPQKEHLEHTICATGKWQAPATGVSPKETTSVHGHPSRPNRPDILRNRSVAVAPWYYSAQRAGWVVACFRWPCEKMSQSSFRSARDAFRPSLQVHDSAGLAAKAVWKG